MKLLQEQAEENLGMVMIFTLVSAAQEKLNEIVDQIKTRREEEKKQKEKEAEEAEKSERNVVDGKQLFETDHNLDTSDIQFLEEAGNSVEVDESLFQEMDDLELEDEEDDPDYNPVHLDSD
ncbi:hypothetical protein JD844_024372 [Phrynosoma platyrhinos]|uniref:RWD domain-containing protein n=1 Tax=Phrynosoma platyrhinos TaxID=52577 RepID=A0ABQ7SY02_PHRPL|nr:hypothetical protein JD844_024372 [Phrynosoma platyrhinos]